MKYLITGIAGTGKSALSAELVSRGLTAYDVDHEPGASIWVEKATGKKVVCPDNAPPGWSRKHDWVWNADVIRKLLNSADEVFICGISSNQSEFTKLFDKIFVLTIDEPTVVQRIASRTNNSYGKDPLELEHIVKYHKSFAEDQIEKGAIAISSLVPIAEVADDILRHTIHDSK